MISFAEHAILLVKTRLFWLLRTRLTKNWPKYLSHVVKAINNSPNSAIGGLRPSQINSPMDDPKIDEAIGYKPDVSVEKQKQNQLAYEKQKKNLQVGNYVFLDFTPSKFQKSFDTKRNQIFRISRVDAGKTPPLYKLKDLKGVAIKGYYYAQQLAKTSRPKRGEFFAVEKILEEKEKRGEPYILVKYLHYGPQYNRWIPRKNLLRDE